ncbi:MAG: iron complex outermembrane receptor protein [Zhongshania sp.]|jgi:iron complex outermembrane receptor protein
MSSRLKAKRKLLGGNIAILIFATVLLTPTSQLLAQADTQFNKNSNMRLEEVIVTAQKRSEDVRDVPISIAVMTGDDMTRAGIKSFNDMARFIPNISLNDSSSSLYVRGIGSPELNPVGEQAIAFIIDGVYLPRADYLKPGFMDLERIEVLKGPQGTLFGRNASGGVINITNGRPTEEWLASISLAAGERNIKEGEAVISGPITDNLAFRFAAKRRMEDGSTYSVTSKETIGDRELEQSRLILRYDAGINFDVTLGYTQFDYRIDQWLGSEFHVYPDDFGLAIKTLDPNLETNLDRRTSAPNESFFDGNGFIVPLTINFDISEHTLTSITSIAKLDDTQGGDVDNSAADITALPIVMSNKQFSQELRFISAPGNFEYVAGLYYFQAEQDSFVQLPLYIGANTIFSYLNDNAPGGSQTVFGNILDLVAPLVPTGSSGDETDRLDQDSAITTKSSAIFGQFKWQILEDLALIMGGRYSRDVKDGSYDLSSAGPVPIWPLITGADFRVETTVVDTDFSPKVSLSWEPMAEATLYATYAQGFRAGSYNNGATFPDQVLFGAESSDTYELGIKTELLDGAARLNIGLFQTDYYDYQITTFVGLGYVTSNAEEVQSRGVEADGTIMLFPGFIINGNIGYNDARFIKHTNGGCPTQTVSENPMGPIRSATNDNPTCDLSGRGLHRAPLWNGSMRADYVFDFFGLGFDMFAGVDATFKDHELFDSDLDPLDSQKAYWLYSARIGAKSKDDIWRFEVHGKNLGDELVKLWSGDAILASGGHYASTNDPQYFFATFSYRY